MRWAGVVMLVLVACRSPETTADASMTVSSAPFPQPKLLPTTPSLPIPSSWPASVPIYPDAHVSKLYTRPSRTIDGGTIREIEVETPDDMATVLRYYRDRLASAKKVIDMDLPMTHALQFEAPREIIDIAIVTVMGLTQIHITVDPR